MGIVSGTAYYIVSVSGTTIQISATQGGTAITFNASGTPSFVPATDQFVNWWFKNCKLWDGTTVIASAQASNNGSGFQVTISLSGVLASPAANIRIDCNDPTHTTGVMKFNQSGNSKDSTITVVRIQ